MRIVSSPNLRIAAGLLPAALLSIVGYQVFRRWISHGREALLERADDLSRLVGTDRTKVACLPTVKSYPSILRAPESFEGVSAFARSIQRRNPKRKRRFPASPGSGLAPIHLEQATNHFTIAEPQQQTADTSSLVELSHPTQ
jgi:hypothetical protein